MKLRIETLGAQGHGVARTERGQVFVPFTLPGEVVNAAVERDRGTPPRFAERMIDLTIDGIEISVPEGTSVMRAASLAGGHDRPAHRIPYVHETDGA